MDKSIEITDEVMEKINVHAVGELKAEDVYCFSVLLCDNEVDRDNEKFSMDSLKKLAELYIGRTGIFDHDPRGENQTARIYDTQVKEYTDRLTCDGEKYTALMGYAYMVRTEDNRSLIAEIDGGIKKEVSVSCAVERKICSVCGADVMKEPCMHMKGKRYGERLCFHVLESPADAYEWSFVAVPAQRNAGVAKKYACGGLGSSEGELMKKVESACGEMRKEIMRLSYFTKPFVSAEAMAERTKEMDFYELMALKKRLERQAAESEDFECRAMIYSEDADENGEKEGKDDGVFRMRQRTRRGK